MFKSFTIPLTSMYVHFHHSQDSVLECYIYWHFKTIYIYILKSIYLYTLHWVYSLCYIVYFMNLKKFMKGIYSLLCFHTKTFTSLKILCTPFFLTQHLPPTDLNTVSLVLPDPKCHAGEIKWHVEVWGQNLALSYFSLCCFALLWSDGKGFWTPLHVFISLVYIFAMRY